MPYLSTGRRGGAVCSTSSDSLKHPTAQRRGDLACRVEQSTLVQELELELILSQMAQKPMLRGEVGVRV